MNLHYIVARRCSRETCLHGVGLDRCELLSDLADMDSARWFAALARDLAENANRDATASRMLDLVTGATGCSFAAIAQLSPRAS